MSATDELRRMLDERGVRWHEVTPRKVKWFSPVLNGLVAVSERGGRLVLDAEYVDVTPERAIAATLGGACETCPQMDNPDSFIRHLMGRGTCRVKKGSGDTAGWWVCERCGTPFDMIGALACMEKRKPAFCPGCGARIVEVKDGSH